MAWSASPKVSRVEKVPRKKEYIVELSDGSSIRALDEHRSRYGLEEGNSVSRDVLLEITASYEYATARQAAMRLLKTRPRTEREIWRRFRRQGIGPKIAEQVLEDLKVEGLVNDRLFAQLWIKEKVAGGMCGRRRIVMELKSRGIDQTVIADEIALNYDDGEETDIAYRLAERRLRRLHSVPSKARAQRVYSLLLRRGFSADLARAAAEAALSSMETEGKR
jgi:regulatory protein